jgi:hypothetical protein
MDGTALSWNNLYYESRGKILGEDGKTYAVSDRQINGDCIGRRFLLEGEPVTFEPFSNGKFLEARSVVRPWAETGESAGYGLSTYRETCEVMYNDGPGKKDKRYLLRELGGHLNFTPKNHEHFAVGQIVEVGLSPNPNPKGPWRAVHIRRVCDSREEYNTLPPEKRRARPSYASLGRTR